MGNPRANERHEIQNIAGSSIRKNWDHRIHTLNTLVNKMKSLEIGKCIFSELCTSFLDKIDSHALKIYLHICWVHKRDPFFEKHHQEKNRFMLTIFTIISQ